MTYSFSLSLCLLWIAPRVFSQDCSIPFNTPLFDVRQEADVFYGAVPRYNGATDSLRMNIFKPVGDGQVERPVIVVIHGGGFTGGHRNDRNDLCMEFASMGWVAVSISYRLDFYGTWLLSSPWAYDPAEVVRAAYRAQQDARGAIRFLKARNVQDSTSTENVMLWGFSAGAIAALHAAYVDEPSEKPASCGAIGNVSHFLSSYPRPDLGPIEGSLNLNGTDEHVRGVASFYGGLLDTALISAPLVPALYLYHQTGDPVVGCYHQQGLWGMPLGVGDNYPYLYGSCVTNDHMQAIAPAPGRYLYHPYSGSAHEVHDPDAMHQEALLFLRDLFCGAAPLRVSARVILDGPYDPSTGLMNDALRSLGTFPLMDPYPGLGYVHVGSNEAVPVPPALVAAGGQDAIVDWVLLELRDPNDPAVVVSSTSALLQRDGDVVSTTGDATITFEMDPGTYHLAIRHRNHLSAMTAVSMTFDEGTNVVDFTSSNLVTYGNEARRSVGGNFPAMVLWTGDADPDGVVKYAGMANDRDPILQRIGGSVPTNTVAGYHAEDLDLDGVVKYAGASNDRDAVLGTVGGSIPTAVRTEQLP